MNKKIKLIALFGEAGSGKDACLHQVCSVMGDRIHEIVSSTTRPPRQGEKNHFLSFDEYNEKIKNNQFFETSSFRGWYYGTTLDELDSNKVNIGVFNPAGVKSISEKTDIIDPVYIWIQASPKNRLLRQLNREKNPDCDEIVRRYGTDKKDFAPYYYGTAPVSGISIINNDYLDVAEVCKPIVSIALNFKGWGGTA